MPLLSPKVVLYIICLCLLAFVLVAGFILTLVTLVMAFLMPRPVLVLVALYIVPYLS
jgi:hypothetical protein